MALALIGLGLLFAIVIVPLVFVLMAAGLAAGGLPGLVVGLISSLFLSGDGPWIVGLVVGLPIFLIVLALPLLFVSGLVQVFTSGVWTLTYREARALG